LGSSDELLELEEEELLLASSCFASFCNFLLFSLCLPVSFFDFLWPDFLPMMLKNYKLNQDCFKN
jgi:hypothetical protein